MKYVKCPECGNLVEETKEACTECGYPICGDEEKVVTKVCPECGKVLEETKPVCSQCGYPFDEGAKDFEELLKAAENKAREHELEALEAEEKLKRIQEERVRKEIEEKREKEKIEKQRKLAEIQERIKVAEERTIEARKKIVEAEKIDFREKEEVKLSEEETDRERANEIVNDSCMQNNDETICITESSKLDTISGDYFAHIKEENHKSGTENIIQKEKINKGSIGQLLARVTGGKLGKRKYIYYVAGGLLLISVFLVGYLMPRRVPVESIELEYEAASIELGNRGQIAYKIVPFDATNKEVEWESSDDSIVSVDQEGYITALKNGICEITVKAQNGKSDSCEITVKSSNPDV